jgi:hypothetical protein
MLGKFIGGHQRQSGVAGKTPGRNADDLNIQKFQLVVVRFGVTSV